MVWPKTTILFDGFNHLCAFADYDTEGMLHKALNDVLETVGFLAPDFPNSSTKVVFVWDPPRYYGKKKETITSSKQFRSEHLAEYKKKQRSSRISHTMECKPLFEKMLKDSAIPSITQSGIEADDIISFFCRILQPNHSVIVSQDADFLPLVSPHTSIMRNQGWLDYENFQKTIGMTPQQFLKMKALSGDPSDNIPAVLEKSAARNFIYTHQPPLNKSQDEAFKRNLRLISLDLWKIKGAVATESWRGAYRQLKSAL